VIPERKRWFRFASRSWSWVDYTLRTDENPHALHTRQRRRPRRKTDFWGTRRPRS